MGNKSLKKDLNKCKMIKAVRTHKGSISGLKFSAKLGLIVTSGLNVNYKKYRMDLSPHST